MEEGRWDQKGKGSHFDSSRMGFACLSPQWKSLSREWWKSHLRSLIEFQKSATLTFSPDPMVGSVSVSPSTWQQLERWWLAVSADLVLLFLNAQCQWHRMVCEQYTVKARMECLEGQTTWRRVPEVITNWPRPQGGLFKAVPETVRNSAGTCSRTHTTTSYAVISLPTDQAYISCGERHGAEQPTLSTVSARCESGLESEGTASSTEGWLTTPEEVRTSCLRSERSSPT